MHTNLSRKKILSRLVGDTNDVRNTRGAVAVDDIEDRYSMCTTQASPVIDERKTYLYSKPRVKAVRMLGRRTSESRRKYPPGRRVTHEQMVARRQTVILPSPDFL